MQEDLLEEVIEAKASKLIAEFGVKDRERLRRVLLDTVDPPGPEAERDRHRFASEREFFFAFTGFYPDIEEVLEHVRPDAAMDLIENSDADDIVICHTPRDRSAGHFSIFLSAS
jgi:hypothetical protein